MYDAGGAGGPESSPKQIALDKRKPHIPMSLLMTWKNDMPTVVTNPNRIAIYGGKKITSHFKNTNERYLGPLGHILTWDKTKEWIWTVEYKVVCTRLLKVSYICDILTHNEQSGTNIRLSWINST